MEVRDDGRNRTGWKPGAKPLIFAAVAATVTLASLVPLHAREQPTTGPSGVPAPGVTEDVRQLYLQHCAACHGAEGHGDGAAAEQLYPKPRSFQDSPFRFAATGAGAQSALAAIERTIRHGMSQSAMPGFDGSLADSDIVALARYVADLSKTVTKTYERKPVVDKPNPPPPFTAWVEAQGAFLYRNQLCINCHGETGHGDGPEMKTLVDSLGRPVQPADLASGLFKSGSSPEELYRTIVNGVPGTPMTGYGALLIAKHPDGSMDDSAVWSLVAYIMSLSPPLKETGQASGADIRATTIDDPTVLMNPAHPAWINIPSSMITIRPLWQRRDRALSVNVSFIRTADAEALRIWWKDPTCDVDQDLGRFADAVAVMFSMSGEVPALPMGVEVTGHTPSTPVNLWQWKANRQFDASAGKPHDSDDPRILPDGNYFLFAAPSTPTADPPKVSPIGAEYGHDVRAHAPHNRAASTTGNPHADPALLSHAVLEANALGFGTLAYQAPEHQNANSTAVWANGHWFVTLYRPIRTDDQQDVDLATPRRVPVSFAVWDGARGDRNGIKLISGWHWLVIE